MWAAPKLFHYSTASIVFFLAIFLTSISVFGYEASLFHHSEKLLQFDAKLYFKISLEGYSEDWLCAFFPLFPFLWHLIGQGTLSISLLNALFFVCAASYLGYILRLGFLEYLFCLSIPSVVFMLVPYTEALFFTICTVLIAGLRSSNPSKQFLGLFFSSLVRPTSFVFAPAILFTYLLGSDKRRRWSKFALCTFALSAGLGATIFIHHYFTGKWFVFFEAQKMWKNYLHVPQLPLTSWGGDFITRLDGTVLFCAIVCLLGIVQILRRKILPSPDVVFSSFYVLGTAGLILAFRDGNLYSLNRFVYCTPFIIVLINYYFKNYTFKARDLFVVIVSSELLWLFFGSYNHIQNLGAYSVITCYFVFLVFSKHRHIVVAKLSLVTLILANSTMLIFCINRYLNGKWVG